MKRKMSTVFLTLFSLLLFLTGCSQGTAPEGTKEPASPEKRFTQPPEMQIDPAKNYTATISTSKGDITIQLFAKDAPVTVNNFVFLAKQKYYENIIFHRVIDGYMIQTGDPEGTGRGGPGYEFKDELNNGHKYEPGIVAMTNRGPNTNGSQFFIGSGEQVRQLNSLPNYTIFGKVTDGMDVVQAIAAAKVIADPQTGDLSYPEETIKINTITIEEK